MEKIYADENRPSDEELEEMKDRLRTEQEKLLDQ